MLPHATDRPTTHPHHARDDRRTGARARSGNPVAAHGDVLVAPVAVHPGALGGPVAAFARVLVAGVGAVLVGLALAVLGAGPAAAHSALVSSDPADGSTLAAAPAHVTLTFNEPAVTLGTVVQVRAADGRVVSAGDPVLTDASVTQDLTGELPAGAYTVLWRVTSADGHPIEGQLTFTAQGPTTAGGPPGTAATDPAATPTATPAASPTPTAAPTATPTAAAPEATASAEPAERDPAAEASATDALLTGTVVALAALGVVVAVLIRRRPHGHGGPHASSADGGPRVGPRDGAAGEPDGAAPDGSTGTRDGSTGD